MKQISSLLFLFLSLSCFSQNPRFVAEADIPGVRITRHDSFAGQDLYSYLDNHAGLFLEYGFKKAWVFDYSKENTKITFECYTMEDGASAFGIYSVSVNRCMYWNSYSAFSCATPYQIAVATGPFFINAVNNSGGQDGFGLCEQVVKMFLAANPQESWYAPPMAQEQRLSPFVNSLRYYDGSIGVSMGIPIWSDLFSNLQFNLFTINIQSASFAGVLGRIMFDDPGYLSIFLMRAGISGPSTQLTPVQTSPGIWRSWLKINDTKIVFLEGSSPSVKLDDYVPPMQSITW